MKMFVLILVLILAGGFAAGYRIHPENFSYYMKLDKSGPVQTFTLSSGQTLEGEIIKETPDAFKINVQGAAMEFSKSEIVSSKTASSSNLFSQLQLNYEKYHKIHPLLTKNKSNSISQKFDNLVNEPGKIADDIRKKNPSITSEGQIAAALETARAVQAQARALQEKHMREMEEANR